MPFKSRVSEEKKAFAGMLRHEGTTSEALLWACLWGKRLHRLKFGQQEVILGRIVDFYCHSKRLIVELDGPHHQEAEQRAEDERRDRILGKHGSRCSA